MGNAYHKRDILANTGPTPCAKSKGIFLHLFITGFTLKPSVRIELVCVRAEDLFVTMHDMRIHPDLDALREVLATDRGSTLGCIARHTQRDGRTNTECLGENSLEIR
jgi:hypothetical protein